MFSRFALRKRRRPALSFSAIGSPSFGRAENGLFGFGGEDGLPDGGSTIVNSKTSIMAKTQLDKNSVITDYRVHDKDTGSPEVQIALLTQRVAHLTEHLRTHRKDFHSRRGLIAMTNRRRKLLDYVKKHDLEKYKELLERLSLRR